MTMSARYLLIALVAVGACANEDSKIERLSRMAISSGFQECRDRPELSPVVRIVLSDHEISWNGQPSLLRDIDSAVVDLNKFKPRPVLLLETDRTIDENHFKNVINKIGADFHCGRDYWCCVKINSAFEQQGL